MGGLPDHGDLRISVRSLAGDMLCCLAANRQEPIEALCDEPCNASARHET